MEELNFLKTYVFIGLDNLNYGFDIESNYYFSESDFKIILERVEILGIHIVGMEPWLNGEYYDVLVFEDFNTSPTDATWYKKAFAQFKERCENLQYSASYEIPDELLS